MTGPTKRLIPCIVAAGALLVSLAAALMIPSAAVAFSAAPARQPTSGAPAPRSAGRPAPVRDIVADYDAELRRPDGRVDVDAMVGRLKELGVNSYFWLVWHASTDWEDLKRFLPLAAREGIRVWVYLVPPSESPPHASLYSEPFRLEYARWAEEIARLSRQHPNLQGWVIDDFYANRAFFTPAYVREMRARARRLNPRLAFLPLMYFNEIRRPFVEEYRAAIDGVVVAYPQDREQIDHAWAILNDAARVTPGELSLPWGVITQAGDFVMAGQVAKVLPTARCRIRFRERDDFTGATAGYQFKQLLVDGVVQWEEDVAGGTAGWREVSADVTDAVRGKPRAELIFRLLDKKGVSNFGVTWQLRDLQAEGLELVADFSTPQRWEVTGRGAFDAGFGGALHPGPRAFHIPFIVMTAADAPEFQHRHGDPASPERIATWLHMCLEAWRQGKCDGVVTYCLEKRTQSPTFALARREFEAAGRK